MRATVIVSRVQICCENNRCIASSMPTRACRWLPGPGVIQYDVLDRSSAVATTNDVAPVMLLEHPLSGRSAWLLAKRANTRYNFSVAHETPVVLFDGLCRFLLST